MLSQYRSALQVCPLIDLSCLAIFQSAENQCCKFLEFVLGSQVSYPLSLTYTNSCGAYWSEQEREVTPTCIFSPSSTEDVSRGVAILDAISQLGDGVGNSCPFAIRSGGHTPWAGAANIDGGVTIDLSAINQVAVSADQALTSIGPGARWIDVYLKLDALELAVPGGRVSEVGVGGLVTGGGLSFFSPRRGFACDSVENFEVVLPSGEIVDANAQSNPDLWLALKGGSNNFGVVTRIDLRTFPQGKLWGGFAVHSMDTAQQQLEAFVEFAEQEPYDVYAALIINYLYSQPSGQWVVANNYEYTKPQPYPSAFQRFTNISGQYYNTMRISNLSDFAIELNGEGASTMRRIFHTVTYSNNLDVLTNFLQLFQASVKPVKDVAGLTWALSLQPIPTVLTASSSSTGGNSLGLDPADGNLALVLLSAYWDKASDDAEVTDAVLGLFAKANAYASSKGALRPYIYLNYAYKTQQPIAGYGKESVSKLKATSLKYDPLQTFQRLVPGGFKLPL